MNTTPNSASARPQQRFRSIVTVLAIAVPLTATLASHADSPELEPYVHVDFADLLGDQKSMIGMIHGADTRNPEPGEFSVPPFLDLIEPLKFQVWETGGSMLRKNFTTMVANASENSRAFLRLNAGDAKPEGCEYTGDRFRPYLDPEMYSTYVSCTAEWARDNGIYALEIWNEPNLTTEFRGDLGQPETAMERWHETYHIAHDAIRSVWPEAIIAGPALAKEDQEEWLAAFMDYVLNNDLTLDVISLHETQWTERDFPWTADFISGLRTDYIDDSLFADVGVKEIIVTESTYKYYNEIPASNLGVWFYFEKGGADAAGRACWNVPGGGCFENTLNGLVTTPDENGVQHRTPAWWTSFHYNRTLKNRARLLQSHEELVGMANEEVIIMGAYANHENPLPNSYGVRVTLQNVDQISWLLPNAESIHVRVLEIPRLEKNQPLDEVPVFLEDDFPVLTSTDGSKYVEMIFDMPAHVVRVLELSE